MPAKPDGDVRINGCPVPKQETAVDLYIESVIRLRAADCRVRRSFGKADVRDADSVRELGLPHVATAVGSHLVRRPIDRTAVREIPHANDGSPVRDILMSFTHRFTPRAS